MTVSNGGSAASGDFTFVGGVLSGFGGGSPSTGDGFLNIVSGGKVMSGTMLSSGDLAAAVGYGANSNGTVLIDGTGSTWEVAQRLSLGYGTGSTGTVTVENGGTLQVDLQPFRSTVT